MISLDEATKIIKVELPFGKIQAVVVYENLYIFQVFGEDPDEGIMDPFFSVNKETGEFKEFSILTDGKITEINQLFVDAKKNNA